jgi:hypothetical protein
MDLKEGVARALANGATGCSGGCRNRPCEVDYSSAADILVAFAERMDELAIIEPATTWEAAYKQLRHEVGGVA